MLLPRGKRLTDRDVMLAAAMSHPAVPVHRRPKVAVFATGDELKPPGSALGPGEIVYSNGFALMALARNEGAAVIDLGIVPDKVEATAAAIRRARDAGADVLVTTGGASVGDYDLVQRGLKAEGLELSFWRVALRPGRPMMNGRLGGMHVLGLPGNPVSAYVCAFLFLVPLLRRLAGRTDLEAPRESAVLGCDMPENDERADYLRATLAPRAGRNFRRDADQDPGLVDDGGARKGRLSRGSRGLRARGQSRIALCRSLGLRGRFSGPSTCSRQIKGLRNTHRTYSVRS